MKVLSLLSNKVLLYLVSRYFTYFIQFVTSLIIAVKLGPYYMGIWGFVLLVLNYFQQCNFGISYSFPVFYVHYKEDNEKIDGYLVNSLLLIGVLCFLISFLFIYYFIFGIAVFDKYHLQGYAFWVLVIAILQHYQSFFIQLFRVKNRFFSVAFCQSIVVILNFICVFFFEGENLIRALIAGYVLGLLMCVLLFFIYKDLPDLKSIKFSFIIQKEILKKGFFLFLYGSCFYFIVITIRTIVSAYYTVEEFGLFTFSFTLAHAILLLLEAVSFLIAPKLLSKLSSNDSVELIETISSIRMLFITSAHFLIYVALILFPLLIEFFPKYLNALTSLNLIAVSILANSNVMGYAELLIAKNQERTLSKLAFCALLVNCTIGYLFVKLLHVSFDYVILATMIAYIIYSFSVMWNGEKIIHKRIYKSDVPSLLIRYFPLRLLLPYVSSVVVSIMQLGSVFMIIPLLLFLTLNVTLYSPMKDTILKILHKPEVVNV